MNEKRMARLFGLTLGAVFAAGLSRPVRAALRR